MGYANHPVYAIAGMAIEQIINQALTATLWRSGYLALTLLAIAALSGFENLRVGVCAHISGALP